MRSKKYVARRSTEEWKEEDNLEVEGGITLDAVGSAHCGTAGAELTRAKPTPSRRIFFAMHSEKEVRMTGVVAT